MKLVGEGMINILSALRFKQTDEEDTDAQYYHISISMQIRYKRNSCFKTVLLFKLATHRVMQNLTFTTEL